jgi:Flp pilus assembly protein TadG
VRRRTGDHGTITAFVAVLALALVMVAGLVYDGGQVLATQAKVRDIAGSAARAGAQEIDIDALRATGSVIIDPARAEAAARDHLERAGALGTISIDGASVTVTATLTHAMVILPVADRAVSATDTVTATPGLIAGDSDG